MSTTQFEECTSSILDKASEILFLETVKKDSFLRCPLEQQQQLYAALVADIQVLQDLCINLGKVVANTSHNRSQ